MHKHAENWLTELTSAKFKIFSVALNTHQVQRRIQYLFTHSWHAPTNAQNK